MLTPPTAFKVSDIMTRTKDLRRADSLDDARKLFHEYDVVPFPRTGDIKGFFQQDNAITNDLKPNHLVSDATDLLELPHLLAAHRFFFVIAGNRVVGYVHYSDLNKHVVVIPLFGLFRTVERLLWDRIRTRIEEADLLKVFSEREIKGFLRKKRRLTKDNVDLGWSGVFSFPGILKLARRYGAIHHRDDEIEILRKFRNKIAHADGDLVENYHDVELLSQITKEIGLLLEEFG
jgi:hypothetical protein